MLKNQKKNITLTANSVISLSEGDTPREVIVEGYSCTIDGQNPGNMNVSKYFQSDEGKALYKDNRSTCRADYAAFEDACYELQDEMIAELETAAGTE